MRNESEYLYYVVPSNVDNEEFEFLDKHYLEHDYLDSAEWSIEDKIHEYGYSKGDWKIVKVRNPKFKL